MALAFNALIFLIASAPVVASIGDPVTRPIQIMAIAFGAVALASGTRQTDANHVAKACRGIGWIAVLVPFLILTQLLPLPLSWSHPIWTSADEALPVLSNGHITVDIGRTVEALVLIVALITATGVAIAAAHDRRRAELMLLAAAAVTTFLSLAVLIQTIAPGESHRTITRETAISFGALGIILNAAVILLAVERRETRRKEAAHYLPIGLGGLAAILINAMALHGIAGLTLWIASGFGLAVLLLLLLIRRLALSRWTIGALCTAALVATGIIMAWLFEKNASASGLLRFIPPPGADMMALLQRVLADSRWLGSGANTFDLVTRIYQSVEATGLEPPTSAIALAVEMGWGGLLIFALSALALFATLFVGALERGRDWFFPATAAASIALCLCSSLTASGLLQFPFAIMLAILIGIGLSQGFSQSARH